MVKIVTRKILVDKGKTLTVCKEMNKDNTAKECSFCHAKRKLGFFYYGHNIKSLAFLSLGVCFNSLSF
jgi:hypothetical protein